MGAPGFWDDQAGATRDLHGAPAAHAQARALRAPSGEHADAKELSTRRGRGRDRPARGVARGRARRLQEDALFDGQYDAGDAVLEIHAGTGGTDAQDWADMPLARGLRHQPPDRGFETETIEASPGEEAGLKSATVTVKGENAYGTLKAERGVHRLVRLSPFDSAHRRHTAFAQVVVAPLLPDDAPIEIDEVGPRIDTYRSSGAGGST